MWMEKGESLYIKQLLYMTAYSVCSADRQYIPQEGYDMIEWIL